LAKHKHTTANSTRARRVGLVTVQRWMAPAQAATPAVISKPLSFTTPVRNKVIGVMPAASPSSARRRHRLQSRKEVAAVSIAAQSSTLRTRIATKAGNPEVAYVAEPTTA